MQSNFREIVEALNPFLQALDRFGIPYYVGGSVASSYYGNWRRTQDVDVILDARPDQIRTLAKILAQDYLIDADAWIDAIRHGHAFNIFYQPTFTKIDVMPLQTTHRKEEARRAPYPPFLRRGYHSSKALLVYRNGKLPTSVG